MATCGACGAKLLGTEKFCSACGAPIAATPAPAPASPVVKAKGGADPFGATVFNPIAVSAAATAAAAASSAAPALASASATPAPTTTAQPHHSQPPPTRSPSGNYNPIVAPPQQPPPTAHSPSGGYSPAPAPPTAHSPSGGYAPAPTPPAPATFAQGARVLVQWSDGNRYPGTVAHSAGAQCFVTMSNGQQLWVAVQYLSPF